LDDDPPRLGVQLNFLGQLRLVQQDFRDTNPTGVADANDAGLGRHVTTL
jgi:hypothetical protein